MARRLKGAWFTRAAVVAAVCALPLIAVGSAQAAIAGANAPTTSLPDLRSATITSFTPAQVDFCFDKALDPTSQMFNNPGAFLFVDGYRANNFVATSSATWDGAVSGGNPNCAKASFTLSLNGDINQYTVFTVEAGGAKTSAGGTTNISDSVALVGSTTHNGTTGNTTAPDLTGVVPATSTNSITYSFNKATSPLIGVDPQKFWYEDARGDVCNGSSNIGGAGKSKPVQTNSATGFTVTVFFPTGAAGTGPGQYTQNCAVISVGDALRAGIFRGGVTAASDIGGATNVLQSTLIPNVGGQTALPDETSAKLDSNNNSVDYTFDQPIDASTISPGDFTVFLSNGSFVTGTSAGIGSGGTNTVTVTFGANSLFNVAEYAVVASVSGTAVQGSGHGSVTQGDCDAALGGTAGTCSATNTKNTDVFTNSPGSAPVGDNSGAFARGFTTGADAFSTTFNSTTGVVQISLDQRVATSNPAGICLYNSAGAQTGCATSSTPPPFPGPGPETVAVQFPLTALSGAVALQLNAFFGPTAFQTGLGGLDGSNVQQVLAPISSGAILREYRAFHHKHSKHHTKKHSKKHSKKH